MTDARGKPASICKPKTGERILSLFFPDRCLLCGQVVFGGQFFCPDCQKAGNASLNHPIVRKYALPGAGAKGFQVISPLPYREGYKETLYEFKFRGYSGFSLPLGRLMASALPDTGSADCVCWVPLSKKSKEKRGYDQSRLLAKSVAKALGLPLLSLLEKAVETGVQHDLSPKEREQNVKGAYRASPETRGKAPILVDDIITTGSTMRECAMALYGANAREVLGLCAADANLLLPDERGSETYDP